jgi:hypothetical protein
MSFQRRALMDARWTWAGLYTVKERAEAMSMPIPTFWSEVSQLKSYLDGYLANAPVEQNQQYTTLMPMKTTA